MKAWPASSVDRKQDISVFTTEEVEISKASTWPASAKGAAILLNIENIKQPSDNMLLGQLAKFYALRWPVLYYTSLRLNTYYGRRATRSINVRYT